MDITNLAGFLLVVGMMAGGIVAAGRGVLRLLREGHTYDSTSSPVPYDEAPHLYWLHFAGFVGLGLFCLCFGVFVGYGLLSW
ncbi:hypothetical protein Pla123a_36610 [Posidoniimonas polymericola]|uniref:Uncharacterized protein n=1 Tax=Posidoniimonas polymericola TaxID=2528002 RepID=A0A5C5YDF5_9BACT|nr:hypothetical protein [Posidoniimonas polymericola]TWT73767.1 hypothetical protein Pla123a_36610 [Posidoniimonas polymericola]